MAAELEAALLRLRGVALRRIAERCRLPLSPARAEALARETSLAGALDLLEAEQSRRLRRLRGERPEAEGG